MVPRVSQSPSPILGGIEAFDVVEAGIGHSLRFQDISYKTLGVGSSGCGPQPLEPYVVYAKPITFSYQLQLSKKAPVPNRGSVGALLKN